MIAVRVVEGPIHEVVDVITVRDLGVPAARVVLRGALDRRAGRGASLAHLEDVLDDAGRAGRVEVTVMEIIRVIAMTNGPMTASRPVLVGVVVPVLHGGSPSSGGSIVGSLAPGQAGSEGA